MRGALALLALLIGVLAGPALAADKGPAWTSLNAQQKSAAQAFATSGARVGDPGHNLTGVN